MTHARTVNRPLSELAVIHPQAAGLDIGSDEIWVAVSPSADPQPVRKFGTFTPDLEALADWLGVCGVETVAMESTGIYWIPVYEMLQARGLQPYVVNARHYKSVPGRKSDIQDCQWLRDLHRVGLLQASFRPEAEVVVLRSYLRQRAMLIDCRALHIQHLQKALLLMNLQLTLVLTDITGVTGQAIIRAIVAGERDPQRLAALRDGRCQKTEDEIAKALTGHYRAEHLFALQQALALYDFYTTQIAACDEQIEAQFSTLPPAADELPPLPPAPKNKRNSHSKNAPPYAARAYLYRLTGVDLVAIPGLNESTVQTIIAEVGTDMGRFPSVKHFCSWLGLAPHNDISGGKRLRSRTLKTANRAGQAFRLAAQAVAKSRQSALGAFYRRMKARHGPQQAIVATAHKMARMFYHILSTRTPFTDLSADEYDRLAQERERKHLLKRAARLGLQLVDVSSQTPTLEASF